MACMKLRSNVQGKIESICVQDPGAKSLVDAESVHAEV